MDSMKKQDLFFQKIPFYLFAVLIILLPLQAFLITWVRHIFNLSANQIFFISLWKEYIFLVLAVIAGIKVFTQKKSLNLILLDKAIILFSILGVLYFFIFSGSIIQKISGLRYDFEFLGIYFLARILLINLKQFKTLLMLFLGISVPVTIFGLLQINYLPPSFLTNFGYSINLDKYVESGIISTYEAVNPSLPSTYRIQSTFPGALQFSSYLVLTISIVSSLVLFLKDKMKKSLFAVLGLISLIALFSTHTRSAWVGIIFGLFIISFFFVRKKIYVVLPTLLIILTGTVLIFSFFKVPQFQTIILHGEVRDNALFGSTQAHQEALTNSINVIYKNPLGKGLGTAGPASKVATNTIIPENSYLQLIIELGFLGFLIFISVIILLFKKLYDVFNSINDSFLRAVSLGLIGALTGISISAMFLHTWTDTATIYPLFIFVGFLIALSQSNLKQLKA